MQILKEDEKSSEIFDSYKRKNSLLTNASHCLMLACKEIEHKL